MLHEIDLSRTDLNLFVLFEAVMETRHVGRASARLNLSPSAVSHGLGRLRAMLDDPLFLRTPKGVTPTARAVELAPSIADLLARVRGVVASASPFDPATSARRFTVGAPDGVSAVILQPLLNALRSIAPGIDLAIRQVLPKSGEPSLDLAWRDALASVEVRAMDMAILPWSAVPARFITRTLYEEDFVIAARTGHPFLDDSSLEAYCAARHLVVSETGDPTGFVDTLLAARNLSRRVALTTPNFMFGLSVLADTDLISALPRRFVALYGPRFGVVGHDSPLALPGFTLSLVMPKVALKDAGLAWLAGIIERSARTT